MKTTAAVLFLGIISTCACFQFANADDDVDNGTTTTQRHHLPVNQGTNPPTTKSQLGYVLGDGDPTTLPMVDSCIL